MIMLSASSGVMRWKRKAQGAPKAKGSHNLPTPWTADLCDAEFAQAFVSAHAHCLASVPPINGFLGVSMIGHGADIDSWGDASDAADESCTSEEVLRAKVGAMKLSTAKVFARAQGVDLHLLAATDDEATKEGTLAAVIELLLERTVTLPGDNGCIGGRLPAMAPEPALPENDGSQGPVTGARRRQPEQQSVQHPAPPPSLMGQMQVGPIDWSNDSAQR